MMDAISYEVEELRSASPERLFEQRRQSRANIVVKNTFIDIRPHEEETDSDADASCPSPQRKNVSAPPSPTRRGGRQRDVWEDGVDHDVVSDEEVDMDPGAIPIYTWASNGLVTVEAPEPAPMPTQPPRRNVELPIWLQKPAPGAGKQPQARPNPCRGRLGAGGPPPALGDYYLGGGSPPWACAAPPTQANLSGYVGSSSGGHGCGAPTHQGCTPPPPLHSAYGNVDPLSTAPAPGYTVEIGRMPMMPGAPAYLPGPPPHTFPSESPRRVPLTCTGDASTRGSSMLPPPPQAWADFLTEEVRPGIPPFRVCGDLGEDAECTDRSRSPVKSCNATSGTGLVSPAPSSPNSRPTLSGGGPKRTDYVKKYGGGGAAPSVEASAERPAVTTMMLKNIPCRKSQEQLMALMDQYGYANTYDFLYLPNDIKFRANLGYAFINFVTPEDAARFKGQMNGFKFPGSGSVKACSVVPAHVQGLMNNLAAFKRTEVMRSNRKPFFLMPSKR